jgi:hypothetical protein
MVEVVDGRFTANAGPTTRDGNLYKELCRRTLRSARSWPALETNEEGIVADISGYRAFHRPLSSADEANVLTTLGHYMMDLDTWRVTWQWTMRS